MISDSSTLRHPPPADRSAAQLANHFAVEQAIAQRLMRADRGERAAIYRTMYAELFAKVPDHPRLTRRADPTRTAALNAIKMRLLQPHLSPESIVVEFGCGDCRFAYELSGLVRKVIGVDISDQRDPRDPMPPNFELTVYDGYNLSIEPGSVNVVFSDQLIEHFHPDDTRLHFETVRAMLKPGGVYVFRTPHRFSGPHDVSKYFSDTPLGFHLKEWTYGELARLLRDVGYRGCTGIVFLKGRPLRAPLPLLTGAERVASSLPGFARRPFARLALRETCLIARA